MLTELNRALQLSVQSLFSSRFPTDLPSSGIAGFWAHGTREKINVPDRNLLNNNNELLNFLSFVSII